jgi:hypothetical protein
MEGPKKNVRSKVRVGSEELLDLDLYRDGSRYCGSGDWWGSSEYHFSRLPNEAKCLRAAAATEASERVDLGAVELAQALRCMGNYRIVSRCGALRWQPTTECPPRWRVR